MGNVIFGGSRVGSQPPKVGIQKSKAGVPRPIVFGTVRPIVGNIIAASGPTIGGTTKTQSIGPLGVGGEIKQNFYSIFRTYAIRICEGPVTAVTRAWRNNELVFVNNPENYVNTFYPDSSEDEKARFLEAVISNLTGFQQSFEFFLGGFDQMPSAVMQSAFGIANVHGYRGTCYMVAEHDNLTATDGAIPQWSFEVSRCPSTPMGFSVEGERLHNGEE